MDSMLDRYARNLTRREAAESYSTKYERIWHKRISDQRERRVFARALALTRQPHASILDMPCGAGRMLPELIPQAPHLLLCDYSLAQIAIARARHSEAALAPARGDALNLPFASASIGLVVSLRLSHHIGAAEDRARYLRELCRVAASNVIATIFDTNSLKNRLREWRRRLYSNKRSKHTMTVTEVADLATAQGFELKAALPLSALFSGHRFVVLERVADPRLKRIPRAAMLDHEKRGETTHGRCAR